MTENYNSCDTDESSLTGLDSQFQSCQKKTRQNISQRWKNHVNFKQDL